MRTFTLLAFVTTGIASFSVSALADKCEWNNRRVERPDVYEFATSSWVRAEHNGHRYYTCVENLQDRALWINWFIPGPKSYIPARTVLSSPRWFSTRATHDIDGCLQYGNHREPMKELFIGHAKDVPRENLQGNCEGELASDQPAGKGDGDSQKSKDKSWLGPIKSLLELFVATNADDVDGTLMHVTIDANLDSVEPDVYQQTLTFSSEPVAKEFRGSARDVSVQSTSADVAKALASQASNKEPARLSSLEKPLVFSTKIPGPVEIDNVSVGFFDVKGRFVGSVFLPSAVPQSAK
jgi:hypothetical protein